MFANKESKKVIEEISSASNVISKGTSLTGDIETFGNLRVEGKITGNIRCKSKIAQGESAVIEGTLIAQNAEFAGTVKGKIEISEMLVLKASCIIEGEIITNKLTVEPGASFNGTCKMGHIAKEIKLEQEGPSEKKARLGS